MATIVGTRNPIFYRNVPGGVPAIIDTAKFSGNVFYVDSNAAGAADTAGHGMGPDGPFATIDFAITQCTASQGDVILVLPGHAETINAAGAIDLDIAGITVLGLGVGNKRPTITIGSSADTATVVMSAADCKIANVIMVPGNDGVDVLLDINADGAVVEDCELRSDETNAYQADTYIDINGGGANAADRAVIRRCTIASVTAGATQAIEIGAVEDALVIEDCHIYGDYAVAGIHSGSAFTNAKIARNYIENVNAGDFCIELSAAATGLLVDNRFYADAAATTLDPGSMTCINNLMVNAIDQSSIPVPTTAGGVLPTGAIGAASFAAGAIDAAAIANGAIDAATFAASAIDSAAIATGAIDADAIAASAFTATKFAGSIENCVEKSDGAVLNATIDPLFTITGGPVLAQIVGIVTTIIGGVANGTLQITTTDPAATVSLSTTVAIDNDASGTSYRFVGATGVLTPDTSGAKIIDPVTVGDCWFLCPIGSVGFLGSAAQTGNIKWYMRYKPLSPSSVVVAAA